jgi:hypothetical protein
VPTPIKPIFLLADSQLLFWRDEKGATFLSGPRALLDADELGRPARAAYLGASNGDAPEFFELFVAAMAEINIRECHHVPAKPSPEDMAFLDAADVILLAGGEVRQGWDAFASTGVKDKLGERYYAGALLIGLSAGAIQLGLIGWDEEGVFDALRLVPFVVDAHDEPAWQRLLRLLPKAGEHARGFGIPSGAGVLYHPDYSVEPIRHPLTEVELGETGPRQALVFPGETVEGAEGPHGETPPGPVTMTQEEILENVLRDLDPGEPGPDDPVN